MRLRAVIASITVGAVLTASPVWARQQHIVDTAVLRQAIADRQVRDEANRQLVARVLERSDVQLVANHLRLDIGRARQALNRLSSEELAAAAESARTIEDERAGGAQSVTLSITTLLLIIIVVLLIVLVAK